MGAASALQPQTPPAVQPAPVASPLAPRASKGASPLDARVSALQDKERETEAKLKSIVEGVGQPPTPPDLPPMPTPKNTNPIEAWGSAAMALAAIGSLMTRQPMTTALNSAAAAMKAFKQNDTDAANAEFERWKANTDYAIKVHNFQMEAYKTTLEKAKVDENAAMAELKAYTAAFGDVTMAEVADTRRRQGAEKLMLDREKVIAQLLAAMPKIEEGKAFKQAYESPQFQKELAAAKPEDRLMMVAQLMPGDSVPPQAIEFFAAQYNKTGKMAPIGMKAGGLRNQILAAAARQAFAAGQTADGVVGQQAQYKSDQTALAAVTKTQSLMAAAENKANRDADFIVNFIDGKVDENNKPIKGGHGGRGLGPLGLPTFDKWVRAGRKATGDPDVVVLDTLVTSFKNEYAKIKSGSLGVAGSTDNARNEAADLINGSYNIEQLKANLAAMKAEMRNSLLGMEDQRSALVQEISQGGPTQTAPQAPAVGTVEDGYTFKGGDPSDQDNWAPADDSGGPDDDTQP